MKYKCKKREYKTVSSQVSSFLLFEELWDFTSLKIFTQHLSPEAK